MSTIALAPTQAAQNLATLATLAKDKLRFAQAMKAVRSTQTQAQAARSAATSFVQSHKRASGLSLAAAASSPAVYHLGLKIARKAALGATELLSVGINAVSHVIGEVGHLAAKVVGLFSKTGEKKVQMGVFALDSFITEAANVVRDVAVLVIETNYSVAYCPTVTKAVTRTAKAIVLASLANWLTRGIIAARLSMIPVAGPILAGALISLSGAWELLKLAALIGTVYVVIKRPQEAYGIFSGRVTTPQFVDELAEEMGLTNALAAIDKAAATRMANRREAEAAVVSAAEQMTVDAAGDALVDATVAQAQADLAQADAIVSSMRPQSSKNRYGKRK